MFPPPMPIPDEFFPPAYTHWKVVIPAAVEAGSEHLLCHGECQKNCTGIPRTEEYCGGQRFDLGNKKKKTWKNLIRLILLGIIKCLIMVLSYSDTFQTTAMSICN